MGTVDLIMPKLHVMIVSLPGIWQKMLQNNMESYPFVEVDHVVSGGLSALQSIKKQPLSLVVIDSSIPVDDAKVLIQRLKEENPKIEIIILTDATYQQKTMIRNGADYAISSCTYEAEIAEILEKMNKLINKNVVP
jgi:DNA-binding NarL/FixJ family response regulator